MIKITPAHEQTIKQVCKLANPRATITAYANVLIDAQEFATTITAGDGVVEMNAKLDCIVQSGGLFMVGAQKFAQALSACGFDAAITIKDGYILVKSKGSKFKLTTLDPETYPAYEDTGKQAQLNVELCDIKSSSVSCANGDARAFLNGVYVGAGIAASDGHRITTLKIENQDKEIIIPADAIMRAPDGEPKISTDGRIASFDYGNSVFKTKLIDARYPNFDKAINQVDKKINVNAEELKEAIKSAMLTGEQVTLSTGRIQGESKNNDATDIEFSATGDEVEMTFNGKYVIDALSFSAGEIEIGFNDTQMIIDNGFRNVVMCVRK